MKTIQPVPVWYNGKQVEATVLNAYVSADNLVDRASFAYELLNVETEKNNFNTLTFGYLSMDGDIYQGWDTNEYAYNWIAEQLNITITGDYVPPTPAEPTVENVENL